jgi:hypothetical protein
VFTTNGTSFEEDAGFILVPGSPTVPVYVLTMIGTSCDVADLKGKPGLCIEGSGEVDIDGGNTLVGFVSSFASNGATPTLSNTVISAPGPIAPIYAGLTALPGSVAVALGTYGSNVYYWTLSDLSVPGGAGTLIAPQTDLLLNYDGNVLGLSLAESGGTALQFLPDGGQPPPLPDLVNGEGSDIPTAYVEPSDNRVVTAGVPATGANAYSGMISILKLLPAPDGG